MAPRLIEVRSLRQSGLDLLTLSSSHFDPFQTLPDFGWPTLLRALLELRDEVAADAAAAGLTEERLAELLRDDGG